MASSCPATPPPRFGSYPTLSPDAGQVLLAMRASTICGSDIRAIYREHIQGDPAEMYQGVVAGHEPAGEVVGVGPGAIRLQVGDRVCVYHISGCGQCDSCVRGYQISCSSPRRAAYGWQRDGGHADLILAEERDCIVLPDFVTFLDGACVACGFGTAYEGLLRGAGERARRPRRRRPRTRRTGRRPARGQARRCPSGRIRSQPRTARPGRAARCRRRCVRPGPGRGGLRHPRWWCARRHRLLGQRARPRHRHLAGARPRSRRPHRRRQRDCA